MKQSEIIAVMLEFILEQSQMEFHFSINDVRNAEYINGVLYLDVPGKIIMITLED